MASMTLEGQVAELSREEMFSLLSSQAERISKLEEDRNSLAERSERLEHQLEWFKRQLFG